MTKQTKTKKQVRQPEPPVTFTFTLEAHKNFALELAAWEIGIDKQTLMRLMAAAFLEMYQSEKRLLLPMMLSQVE